MLTLVSFSLALGLIDAVIKGAVVLVATATKTTQQHRIIIVTKVAAQVDSASRHLGPVKTCSVKGSKPHPVPL